MRKDIHNVIMTFGFIASVLGTGAFVRSEQVFVERREVVARQKEDVVSAQVAQMKEARLVMVQEADAFRSALAMKEAEARERVLEEERIATAKDAVGRAKAEADAARAEALRREVAKEVATQATERRRALLAAESTRIAVDTSVVRASRRSRAS